MIERIGPLNGIRVIDLGRYETGPRCAQVLARLGAEVIKVEQLGGEETRYYGPWTRKQSAYWTQHNSGKKSLSIDLYTDDGKEVLRKLTKVSDVFVENFSPGTIEDMGFGYDVLCELNPRIIMVNISAYGQFGPYRDQIGYGGVGETMSGIVTLTGESEMPPIFAGVPVIARTTAHHAAIGALTALYEREISGVGQSIDVCLADTGYSYTDVPTSVYHGTGIEPIRGELPPPPHGIYQCNDGQIFVSASDQRHWHRVCNALNNSEWLEDSRFMTRDDRILNRDVINDAMNDLLSDMSVHDARVLFSHHDVTVSPVNTIPQAAAGPHVWERRVMAEVDDFQAGTIAVSGDVWHFSRTPAIVGDAPRVGEHNEYVLSDLLNYTTDEVQHMYASNVIGNFDHYAEATKHLDR